MCQEDHYVMRKCVVKKRRKMKNVKFNQIIKKKSSHVGPKDNLCKMQQIMQQIISFSMLLVCKSERKMRHQSQWAKSARPLAA